MMLDLSLGYQVLIQPAVLLIALLYAGRQLLKGLHREETEIDGITVKVTRYDKVGTGKAAVAVILGIVFVLATVVVPFGHRGIVWSTGGVDFNERQPGLSFILPVAQSDVIVDVREQRYTTVDEDGKANAFVQSSDLQEITVRASLIYRIAPDQAAEIYDQVGGPEEIQQIIEPVFFDAIKEESGQRQAASYAAQLNEIADEIEQIVTPQLAERGIDVITVSVEDAVFDPDFIRAIKDKVIADEEAAEQERLVAAEAAKKDQRILAAEALEQELLIAARGEEQAIEQIAQALGFSPDEYLQWLLLTTWDGVLPSTLVGDGTGLDLLLGVE